METAGSVLNYFEPFLGRIEIMGGGKRIERVYFEIKESNIEQWEKPQIKVFWSQYCVNKFCLFSYVGILMEAFWNNQAELGAVPSRESHKSQKKINAKTREEC